MAYVCKTKATIMRSLLDPSFNRSELLGRLTTLLICSLSTFIICYFAMCIVMGFVRYAVPTKMCSKSNSE